MSPTGLSKRLGQPVVVESRLGAGGTVSAAAVARAAPDGHTLTILPSGHPVAAALYKQLSYNVVDDFTFISMLTENPFILVTYPDHPAKTVADVIKAAQADPGKLTYASAGNGTGMHLASELFVAMAKAKIQHIPYRGSPQAITDLLAKRVDFQVDTPQVLLPFLADGRLRPIAITGTKPFFALPGVPTIESGGLPGYSVTGWLGLGAPAGLPARHGEAAQRACPGDFGGACRDRAASRAGRRPDADHARGVQGARGVGHREVDQGDQRREHSEGVERRVVCLPK